MWYLPPQAQNHRVCLTVDGDKLDYEEDASYPAVSLLDTKILLNSVFSDADKGARYYTVYIKNFYLNNTMKTYRYIKISIHLLTDEILEEYQINTTVHKGCVYVEIWKGIYGLKDTGILAYTALVDYLQQFG